MPTFEPEIYQFKVVLQVRTRVLDDELREQFQQWYPRFVQKEPPLKKAA
jgi:hypothetical protein